MTPRKVQILCKENRIAGTDKPYLDYLGKADKRQRGQGRGKMPLQSTMYQKQKIDISAAPWLMHEFFAGSGLVAYGL